MLFLNTWTKLKQSIIYIFQIMEENFISETATLKCRFCKKQLLRKNYKGHIKALHPGENFEDLKPSGQSTINDMF